MWGLSRRAFFGVSVGGLSALQAKGAVLAVGLSPSTNFDRASARNLKLFLQNKAVLGLTGLVNMRPIQDEQVNYDSGSMFLFPFAHIASATDIQAFLPGRNDAAPLVAISAIRTGGLPPDDYFCSFALKVPRENFISFSVGMPFMNGAQKWPWHSNVDNVGDGSIGIGWTSSNLNHRWFAGSRWIPDSGQGKYWRTRIIEDLRRLSAIGGAMG